MRLVGGDERRARLGVRHHLAPSARAADPTRIAGDLLGLHATDPATVYLAAAARMREPDLAAVDRALIEERTLLRVLGMRRTMFVVPVDVAGIVDAACTRTIAARERRRLLGWLADAGVDPDPETWLREAEEEAMRALAARGEATAAEVAADVPRLRRRIVLGGGSKWAVEQAVGGRVLFILAAQGRIVRGRRRGSWATGGEYWWAPLEAWLSRPLPAWETEEAQAELVRRWLAAFGPGTAADIKWWTGWNAGEVKRALARVEPAEVRLDGGAAGYLLAHDVEPVVCEEPWVALLPALDPTAMGWNGRDWYLGDHRAPLFDRSGNIGPTIWCAGRIVGGWARRADGEIAVRLLEDVGAEVEATVAGAADRLRALIGEGGVTPRFRTPLERELTS
jgi:hypothetical protein